MLTRMLVAFAVGRFAYAFVLKYIEPRKLMGICSVINILFAVVCVLFAGWIDVWAIFQPAFSCS